MNPLRAFALSLLLVGLLSGASSVAASDSVKPVSARSTPPPAESPAAVSQEDPVDRLRVRLAERLAGVKLTNTPSALDLRVPTRPVSATAGARLGAPRRAGAAYVAAGVAGGVAAGVAAGAAVKSAGGAGPHWTYSGHAGPQAWGDLRPDFALCKSGQRQSPIDLREGMAVDLEPIGFSYQSSSFGVIDNGHTVQVNLAPGNFMELGGRRFELRHVQFHRPSEERIDGRQFAMSAHLLHKDAEGRLAMVTVLLDPGPAQPLVQVVWNNLPLEKHQEAKARVSIDPSQLLPADRRYYTYMGSLTTPPCTEGVQRVVMRHPVTMSPEQMDIFARMYPTNSRPLQAAHGRRILQSN